MNRWCRDGQVFNWAHQGGARENPSNTLRAMKSALAQGANGIELDVHATSDGRLVVAHDDNLWRMAGADRRIAASTLAEIKTFDPAYNWVPGEVDDPNRSDPADYPLRGRAPNDPDLQVPTLEEVLEAFPEVPLNLELKAAGYEAVLAETLNDHGRAADVVVVSFRDGIVSKFRQASSDVPTAPGRLRIGAWWLCSRLRISLPSNGHVALQAPHRFRGIRIVDSWLVKSAHKSDLAVHAWTVDEPRRMERMVGAGVDGIMTDRPSLLAEVLAARGKSWVD